MPASPFQAAIDRRLADLSMSRYELARRAGMHPNGVYSWWRRPPVVPKPDTLRRVAPILGLDFADLMVLAGYLPDEHAPAPPLDAEEHELLLLAEEFKAGLRGIPRPFWGPVTAALTAAGVRLASELPAVTDAAVPPQTPAPSVTNRPESGSGGDLMVTKHLAAIAAVIG